MYKKEIKTKKSVMNAPVLQAELPMRDVSDFSCLLMHLYIGDNSINIVMAGIPFIKSLLLSSTPRYYSCVSVRKQFLKNMYCLH